jgi:very-short-patch-repair endonuclease
LPIDPEWKRDYSASIRRLVRDGVDVPLANLFVHAFRRLSPEAEGAARARSASEAFLYHRLQTLPATADRFRLNTNLPIPFDTQGQMEVDLLCQELRLAIELDGGQHLADTEAYRRDRRKDAALQEHGYFVLRFLAEDLGRPPGYCVGHYPAHAGAPEGAGQAMSASRRRLGMKTKGPKQLLRPFKKNLAATYSRGVYKTTTIGKTVFDGRVRNGNGSDHSFMATKKRR